MGKSGNIKTYLIIVFITALVLGFTYISFFSQYKLSPDAAEYDTLGWNLTQGKGYQIEAGTPDATREPGYPFFLSIIYAVFGHNYFAVKSIQLIINAATCVIIYFIGKRIAGRATGMIAAGIAVIYPAFIIYAANLWTETLFTFLLTLGILTLIKAVTGEGLKWYLATGIILGLAALVKAVLILFPLFVIPAAIFITGFKKKVLLCLFYMLLAFSLITVPWCIRNYIVFHKFIPVRTGSGFNLWLGSYLPWQGKNIAGQGGYPEIRVRFIGTEPLRSLVEGQNDVEVDTLLRKEALKNINANPLDYIRLSLKRAWWLWKDAIGQETIQEKNSIFGAIFAIVHYLFLLLAAAGILFTFLNNAKIAMIPLSLIIYITWFYSITYAHPRYHFPALPYVILFAGFGLWRITQKFISQDTLA